MRVPVAGNSAGERLSKVLSLEDAVERIARLPAMELWTFRAAARTELVQHVRRRYARQLRENGLSQTLVRRADHVLDPNALTVGFARRFTAYKRPTLVLQDPERLAAMLRQRARPVQLIVAGKAHPNDAEGKRLVQELARFAQRDDVFDQMVYLQDYDIALAMQLVSGVDVWLNTPRRSNEACGTSGMKTLVNGGLHLSTLDG